GDACSGLGGDGVGRVRPCGRTDGSVRASLGRRGHGALAAGESPPPHPLGSITTADTAACSSARRVFTSCSWHCWGDGDLVDDLHGSNVWCTWDGEHLSLHLTLRNDSDHRVMLRRVVSVRAT